MPIKALSDWTTSYQDLFYKDLTPDNQPKRWGDWVHQNTVGMEADAPWIDTSVSFNRDKFPPVSHPPDPTPVAFIIKLANAWEAYISSAIWNPYALTLPPAVSTFSVIAYTGPSVSGVSGAKAGLIAALTPILSINISPGEVIAKQIATAFYTATLSSGFMLAGTGLGPGFAPVTIPFLPIV